MLLVQGKHQLDAWPEPLTLGQPLPTMPLWLDAGLCVPLRFEETYVTAGESLRMPP